MSVAVAGRMDRSLADFERACLAHLEDEQGRPCPDNALIATLCDAVRLVRECESELGRPTYVLERPVNRGPRS